MLGETLQGGPDEGPIDYPDTLDISLSIAREES
jgi:hypothetical protein